jgi:predicted metal-dependent enzyme (double-stranded beta helix superfamily)
LSQTADSPSGNYREVRAFLRELDVLMTGDGRCAETVLAVKERLAALIKQCPALPAEVKEVSTDHYARHLLYRDAAERYEVIVMAWSPGQATPIHDHSGMWCVEGVIEGVIDVTRYDLTQMLDNLSARMQRTETIHAGLGQCGALIPPVEYHSISNPYEKPAFTLHVYGGRMRSCRVFIERGDGTYDVDQRELGTSSLRPALAAS